MILSSNTSPDDKSYPRETSDNINVRDAVPPTTSTDISISRSNIPSINKILITHDGKIVLTKQSIMRFLYQICQVPK